MSSAAIIGGYSNAVEGLRASVQTYAPYTYIAYKSLLPSVDGDLVEFASAICDIASLRLVVQLVAAAVHPIFLLLPFIPLVLDAGRLVYCFITGTELGGAAPENGVSERRSIFRSIATLSLLAAGVYGIHTAHASGSLG